MSLQPVRGTKDLYGEEARKFRWIQNIALEVASRFCFQEIETPIFEFTEVFQKTLGEASDIVGKEMYTFFFFFSENLTLRPEGTAGVARSFISEGMAQDLPLKLIYLGPMFRYERPQKGRLREFHQIGVEILGIDSPRADVETILVGQLLLKELGILEKCTLHLNTIGDPASRTNHRDKLLAYLTPLKDRLSEDSQRRLVTNPLRIFDSKVAGDIEIMKGAPKLSECLSNDARQFFSEVERLLTTLKIEYILDSSLVRGLDYYTHTVFEFRTQHLGAQDAVLAGGRYDQLIELMGGPKTPGVGWACGVERLSLLMDQTPALRRPVCLVPLGEAATEHADILAQELRNDGFVVELSVSGNLAKRLKRGNKLSSSHAIIFGETEMAQSSYQLKNLDTGEQFLLPLSEIKARLR